MPHSPAQPLWSQPGADRQPKGLHVLNADNYRGSCRGLATSREAEEAETSGITDATEKLGASGGAAGFEQALDRALLETYRLLQEGKVEQAEVLLLEGTVKEAWHSTTYVRHRQL